jgi:hypothetical protein
MLGDIDLIFGIWVYNNELQIKLTFRSGPMIFGIWVYMYNEELQIKLTFRSGPMIFGRVMALGLWNLAKYLAVTSFFPYAWRYWLDISFRSNDFWPNYDPWTLKFGHIFSCHHFFSLCLEILTWFLVYECIIMSYRSSIHFVPVDWFLAELWPLDFEIWPNI